METITHFIETPEGVKLPLKIAGIWSRGAAWLIDFLIRGLIYIMSVIVLSSAELFGTGLILLVIFILEWFYPVLYEVLRDGMTPGKKALNIQVLQSNGTAVDWGSSLIRNLLRTVDILPLFYGVGLFSILITDKNQRIGDFAADTIVTYGTDKSTLMKPISVPVQDVKQIIPLSLTDNFTNEEKNAFISYSERYDELSKDRRVELAEIIYPLLTKFEIAGTPENILYIAASILGNE